MSDASKIINRSESNNYISGRKIFLLDELTTTSCAELIGNISNMVDELRWTTIDTEHISQITNPYILPQKHDQVIDIYINSGGGWLNTTKSIMTLLNIARAKGTIIRTTVMGTAASCASLIAIQGTPGFRIMYDQAYNLIHYGRSTYSVDKIDEIGRVAKYEREMRDSFNAPYLQYTNLTKHDLSKYQRTEFGNIPARECLEKNICDWILTADGRFISHDQHQR